MQKTFALERIKASLDQNWELNAVEIEKRREQYGENNIVENQKSRWRDLAKNTMMDPMIWFLIGTSILFLILDDLNQAVILLLATIPLIGMDSFLHWRTQASTQSLQKQLATSATVFRNNNKILLPTVEIVPGDLIIVHSGEFFPADGIIVVGNHLQVDESSLTGEALSVEKKPAKQYRILNDDLASVDHEHWGLAGTRLMTGEAVVRIVYTGKETMYGDIVYTAATATQSNTPLQKSIAKLIFILIVVATVICFLLAGIRYYQGFGIIDAILSAATLAVAALPDEFPIVFTFFLGVGVYRLARQKALVRRAVAVENIGRVTCICTDKTGTITEGRLKLIDFYPADGTEKIELLSFAAAASRHDSGDPIDIAILEKASEFNITSLTPILTFPFTEDRKRETVIIKKTENDFMLASKGAPETMFALCNLNEQQIKVWKELVLKFASQGYKILACAHASATSLHEIAQEPSAEFNFAGLFVFADPPRKEVFSAINQCKQSHIKVVMITGDHPETARAIANQIQLSDTKLNVMTAEEVELGIQRQGAEYLISVDVIARAIPSQKLKFVEALKKLGNIVAVTGDGVNDVPALKVADIGIAMGGRGTQSAREVASIVLLDDNFGSIVNAISEGRKLFSNLKLSFKYLLMLHIPFVFSAAMIPLLGYPLLYLPIHVVWFELIVHPTSMLVFQEITQSKSLERISQNSTIYFFSRSDWVSVSVVGCYLAILVSLSYLFMLKTGGTVEYARSVVIALLGFTSVNLIVGFTGVKTMISRIISTTTIISTLVIIQTPLLNRLLELHPLTLKSWCSLALISLIIIPLIKK